MTAWYDLKPGDSGYEDALRAASGKTTWRSRPPCCRETFAENHRLEGALRAMVDAALDRNDVDYDEALCNAQDVLRGIDGP